MKGLGKRTETILMARLTRRPKSTEASWSQIASEVELSPVDARSCFQMAVPLFLVELYAPRHHP
jgi:hypothetical protein